jgi:hypothetical protein
MFYFRDFQPRSNSINKLRQHQNFGVGVIKINNFFNPINPFCAVGITKKNVFWPKL